MNSLVAKRVLLALAYTDQFLYPLTFLELCTRLTVRASRNVVKDALLVLIKEGAVVGFAGYFAIGNDVARLQRMIATRQKREQAARAYAPIEQELVSWLQRVPWIVGVAITGSLSMGVANQGDDLDVMVITQPNRLWLSRVVVTFLATLVGRRRYWWEETTWLEPSPKRQRVTWCFNLWLTTERLAVPEAQRSLYTAHEVLQARFVYSSSIAGKFLTANYWVAPLLPQFWLTAWKKGKQPKSTQKNTSFLFIAQFLELGWLDFLAFFAQKQYMHNHQTREKIARNMAYFHPRPTQQLMQHGWLRALESVWLPKVRKLQNQNQTIVLVTGVFDVLHAAHLDFLRQARAQGTALVIGIESDVRVRQLKGPTRPINPQEQRRAQLESLQLAEVVFVLPEAFSEATDHLALLKLIKPRVFAVSAHTPHLAEKRALVEKVGGSLVVVKEQDPSISTTILLAEQK